MYPLINSTYIHAKRKCLGLLFVLLFSKQQTHLPFFCYFFCAKYIPTAIYKRKEEGKISRKGEFFYRSRGLYSFLKYAIVCSYSTHYYCSSCSIVLLAHCRRAAAAFSQVVLALILPAPAFIRLVQYLSGSSGVRSHFLLYLRPRRSLYTSSFGHNTHRPRLSLTSGFKPVKYYYQCEIKVFFT